MSTKGFRRNIGALFLCWESGPNHKFLTFGLGRFEIQVNLWPHTKVE